MEVGWKGERGLGGRAGRREGVEGLRQVFSGGGRGREEWWEGGKGLVEGEGRSSRRLLIETLSIIIIPCGGAFPAHRLNIAYTFSHASTSIDTPPPPQKHAHNYARTQSLKLAHSCTLT